MFVDKMELGFIQKYHLSPNDKSILVIKIYIWGSHKATKKLEYNGDCVVENKILRILFFGSQIFFLLKWGSFLSVLS